MEKGALAAFILSCGLSCPCLFFLRQDPPDFQAKRAQAVLVETDQTALWLKPRGEEPACAPVDALQKPQQQRRSQWWLKQAQAPEEAQLVETWLQSSSAEAEHLKPQVEQQVPQGGDTRRLTLIASVARLHWPSPENEPTSILLRPAPIVHAAPHARLELLRDSHTHGSRAPVFRPRRRA